MTLYEAVFSVWNTELLIPPLEANCCSSFKTQMSGTLLLGSHPPCLYRRPHAWTVLPSALCSHSQRLWLGFLGARRTGCRKHWMDGPISILQLQEPPHCHPLPHSAVHPRGPAPLSGPQHRHPPPPSRAALSRDSGPVNIWLQEPATGQALQRGATQEGRSDVYFLLIRS